MSQPIEFIEILCPSCSSAFEISVDISNGDQTLIEDCSTCCAPVEIVITIDPQGRIDVRQIQSANE